MYGIDDFINDVYYATVIPGIIVFSWLFGLISLTLCKIFLLIFIVVFVLLPFLFKHSIRLQRGILFLTFIAYPKNIDLKNPDSIGLYATRNFYVKVKDSDVDDVEEINIGVWHVLPIHLVKRYSKELQLSKEALEDIQNVTDVNNLVDEKTNQQLDKLEPLIKSEFPLVSANNENLFYERMLQQPGVIILYLHGNTASRAAEHRVHLYKVLRKQGYHVITIDYRGYGDSDQIQPTEEGVVTDALTVYKYIKNLTNNPIFLWGHSLGTGVSTHLMSLLSQMNDPGPRGLILESPFTSIKDEVRKHPFAKLFKDLPWFDYMIAKPMHANSLRFESDKHISEFRQPIIILHAEDDIVVPFQLGYKLYRTALDTRGRSWGPVEFHRFDSSSRYGHKYICKAPNLPEIVRNFVEKFRNEIY